MPVVKLTLSDLRMRAARDELEQLLLERALTESQGNVASAAELLDVARPTVYNLIRKFGLVQPNRRRRLQSAFLEELRNHTVEDSPELDDSPASQDAVELLDKTP